MFISLKLTSFSGGIRGHPSIYSGLLILSGLIVFVVTEKVFSLITKVIEEENTDKCSLVENTNNNIKGYYESNEEKENNRKHVSFYIENRVTPTQILGII